MTCTNLWVGGSTLLGLCTRSGAQGVEGWLSGALYTLREWTQCIRDL